MTFAVGLALTGGSLAPIDRWTTSAHDGIANQRASARRLRSRMYVAVDGAGLQQPIAKIGLTEIMHWYQHLIYANERASDASLCKRGTPQIWPHFAAFVPPLTVAVGCDCNPIHPCRQGDAFSGWMASAVKNVM